MTFDQFMRSLLCNPDAAQVWYKPFQEAMDEFGIDSPVDRAMLCAQMGHESGSMTRFSENLNYSAEGLVKTFEKYFPTKSSTVGYANKPEKIASKVYARRYGNGNEESGDGWKYRGRGPIQITFASTYAECGDFLNLDLTEHPELLLIPEHGARSACWFWAVYKQIDMMPDRSNVEAVTKRINGGTHGLVDRTRRFAIARTAFGLN
jgi:putative chitinase